MAKRKPKKRAVKPVRALTLQDKHDEHKVLMFAVGIAFGISICAMVYQFWFPALASLAILVVLLMINRREKS